MFVRRRSRFLTCLNASGGRRDEFARDISEIEPSQSDRRIER
jgi:hypothetical protein